jgi:hypothetical protein
MRSIQWGKIYGIGDSRQGSLLISYVSTNTSTSTSNSKKLRNHDSRYQQPQRRAANNPAPKFPTFTRAAPDLRSSRVDITPIGGIG